jgi:hypothetical protein
MRLQRTLSWLTKRTPDTRYWQTTGVAHFHFSVENLLPPTLQGDRDKDVNDGQDDIEKDRSCSKQCYNDDYVGQSALRIPVEWQESSG